MEETLELIIHGCKLANHLESNFAHFSTQPNVLLNSCDAIVRTFKSAMDRLNTSNPSSSLYVDTVCHELMEAGAPSHIDRAVQEWLRSGYTKSMNLLQFQDPTDHNNTFSKTSSMETPVLSSGANMLDMGGILERSESGKTPVVQRSRKRKDGVSKNIVWVAAPRIGNTEIPPEDGFTWRKYGQKDILGSIFPRGYYRCTHKSFYGCNAKKQVQRLDHQPNIFEVTYYGDHTCHKSSTAPSITLPSVVIEQEKLETLPHSLPTSQPPPIASIPMSRWLSMEANMTGKDTNTPTKLHLQMYKEFDLSGSGAEGSTQVRSAKEAAECQVVDLADAKFNSGSSSNCINAMLPYIQDK